MGRGHFSIHYIQYTLLIQKFTVLLSNVSNNRTSYLQKALKLFWSLKNLHQRDLQVSGLIDHL